MTNYTMTTPIPASITTPDRVHSSIGALQYFDGVPTPETVETVYDDLDRSRAVEVFLNSIPAMSMDTLRTGQAAVGADARLSTTARHASPRPADHNPNEPDTRT